MAAYVDDPRLYQYLHNGTLEPIFRKMSNSRVLGLYMPKREIWDSPPTQFEPSGSLNKKKYHHNSYNYGVLEGIIGIHPEYVINKDKVYVEIIAHFRYEKNEVNPFEFSIKRTVFRAYKKIYPPEDVANAQDVDPDTDMEDYSRVLRDMQRKFGKNYYPFRFNVSGAPDSVWIHDPNVPFKKNGIKWEVRAYVEQLPTEDPRPFDFVSFSVRKLTFVDQSFIPIINNYFRQIDRQYSSHYLDGGAINLQTELDKYAYSMGEQILLHICVTNASNRVVKKIRIIIEQILRFQFWDVKEYSIIIDDQSITNEKTIIPILPRTENWRTSIKILPNTRTPVNQINLAVETPNRPDFDRENEVLPAASTLIRDELNEMYFKNYPDSRKLPLEKPSMNNQPLHIRYQIVTTCELTNDVEGIHGECPRNVNEFLLAHKRPTPSPPIRVTEDKPY